jgi:hypothetical protein
MKKTAGLEGDRIREYRACPTVTRKTGGIIIHARPFQYCFFSVFGSLRGRSFSSDNQCLALTGLQPLRKSFAASGGKLKTSSRVAAHDLLYWRQDVPAFASS